MNKDILKREIEILGSSYNSEEIIKSLKEKFKDSLEDEEMQNTIVELKLEKRTTLGLTLMAIGAFVGFISMMLTVLEVIPELRDFIMFGVTSLAILIVFAGCYLVFEKD